MVTPPWDILTLASLTGLGRVDEIPRRLKVAASGSKNDNPKIRNGDHNYLIYAIEFGDLAPGVFEVLIQHADLNVPGRTLHEATINEGIPCLLHWHGGSPFKLQVTNSQTSGSLFFDYALKAIRFDRPHQFQAFKDFLDARYDHRPRDERDAKILDALQKIGSTLARIERAAPRGGPP